VSPGRPETSAPGEIRIGISSWGSLPGFYPSSLKAGDKLAWYARFFSVVEVNVSFYRLVPPRTYSQWLETTPASLLFDIKAFQELTHFREPPPAATFAAFRESYAPVRETGRLGGILFQFPPRFANAPASRAYLRRVAAEMAGETTVIEFRNQSWLAPQSAAATFALLAELRLAYAVADEPQLPPETVPPIAAVTDPALAYIRLHGRNAATWRHEHGGARYDYDYSAAELAEWSATAHDLARRARQVHILFNNNARGAGTRNALALAQLLGVARADLPPPLPTQPPLFAADA
jgi:uncharacterized protein YecE (DUF72 family)